MTLWDKGSDIDKEIERFTVGDDHLLDSRLVKYDCQASIAHAKMLNKIKLLDDPETAKIIEVLNEIAGLSEKGEFRISPQDEDCHTAIENLLSEKLGETGKKIHAGRSRNDQVVAALKLYMREELGAARAQVLGLCDALGRLGLIDCPLPGYTHMRKAMPSSIKMWSDGFAGSLRSDIILIEAAAEYLDSSPLGSAAGYGTNLGIDREFTAGLLGFKRIQEIAEVQNSRGKNEAVAVFAMMSVMLDLAKMASDIILFSMTEFGYFRIPSGFCTGSSIMPQKKNPDALELIRAKSKSVQAKLTEILSIINGMYSGYSRDFQLTKKPLMESIETTRSCLDVMKLVISNLEVDEAACKQAMTDELYAADMANDLVKKGMSFREAYREIGKKFR